MLIRNETLVLRHGSNEIYPLGISSGSAVPHRSIHHTAAYSVLKPCHYLNYASTTLLSAPPNNGHTVYGCIYCLAYSGC